MRLDAHSTYAEDYLQFCLETALRTGADNVGGVFVSLVKNDTFESIIVQALTTHRFGWAIPALNKFHGRARGYCSIWVLSQRVY